MLSKIVSELTNPKGLGKTDMNKLFKDFNEADLCGLLSKQENFDKSYLDDFYKSIKKGKSIKNVSNVLNEVGTTITVAIWAYNFFKNGDIPSPVDLISSVYWPVGLFSTMVIDDIAEKMEAEVLASMLDDCDWSNVVDWRKYRKKINVPDQELYLYYVYCEQGCTYNPNIIPTSIVVKERQLAYEIFGFYPTHVTFYLGGPDTHSDGKPNTVVKYEGK